ncbi:hypothetical protein ACOSQ4_005074 [Xanthoceras sorbifolium]
MQKRKEKHLKDRYHVYGFLWSLMIFALEVIHSFVAEFTKLSNIVDSYPRVPCPYQGNDTQIENMPNFDDVAGSSNMAQQASI